MRCHREELVARSNRSTKVLFASAPLSDIEDRADETHGNSGFFEVDFAAGEKPSFDTGHQAAGSELERIF